MTTNLSDLFLLDPAVTFLNHGSFGACPRPVFEEYQRWQLALERQPVEFLDSRRGLPCEGCGAATHWIDFEVDGCAACGHAVARARKDGRRTAPKLSCRACH